MDENIFYPELTLETDDIIMELAIKKDYSKIRDSDKRKEELNSILMFWKVQGFYDRKKINELIDEFEQFYDSFFKQE